MKVRATILLISACFWICGQSLHVSEVLLPPSSPPSRMAVTSTSMCPSKTVNYITHRLSQQCLKTGWASANTASMTSTKVMSNFSTRAPHATLEATEIIILSSAVNDRAHQPSPPVPHPSATPSETSAATGNTATKDSGASQAPSDSSSNLPRPHVEVDAEVESALDNANFLSFEEWKKQNLARSGQSADGLGNKRPSSPGPGTRHRPSNIHNALDFLGDDTEIDLDFGSFRSSSNAEISRRDSVDTSDTGRDEASAHNEGDQEATQKRRVRNKDAGKTCKERFNYASFDCAATVLKTNPESKGSSSILVENKDSYMLNECAANNKFFIVELCDDILVDTIVLANFEFFSSIFRTFRVSVSDRYPVKLDRWKELGTYEAVNSRDLQVFLVENPLIWARYLRVEFLTHFGNEYFCPISLLRVHGTTMMEEFKHQEEASKGEEDLDEVVGEDLQFRSDVALDSDLAKDAGTSNESNLPHSETKPIADVHDRIPHEEHVDRAANPENGDDRSTSSMQSKHTSGHGETSKTAQLQTLLKSTHSPVCGLNEANAASTRASSERSSDSTAKLDASSAAGLQPPATNSQFTSESVAADNKHVSSHAPESFISGSGVDEPAVVTLDPAVARAASRQSSEADKVSWSSTHPPPPHPTTQESFFKTVHKRLQLLEANATLSLQYIEEQSRILRDAFNKVEKRQLAKTTTFLENLNATVLAELQVFRQQYDQIWQSTVIELENQREQSQKEMLAISARLSILADEVVLQKRMSIIQSVLLLLCLGFVIFSRGPAQKYLELPIVQSMRSKSQSTLRLGFESPFGSPSSSRPNSSGQTGETYGTTSQRHQPLAGSNAESMQRLTLEFSPPTPTSSADFSGSEDRSDLSVSSPHSTSLALPVRATGRQASARAHSIPMTPTRRRRFEGDARDWQAGGTESLDQLLSDSSPDAMQLKRKASYSQLSDDSGDSVYAAQGILEKANETEAAHDPDNIADARSVRPPSSGSSPSPSPDKQRPSSLL